MAKKKIRNNTTRAKSTLINQTTRLTRYFPENIQKDVSRMVGNKESQRQIIMDHVGKNHPSMAFLFNDNYYREIDVFIEIIEAKHPSIIEDKNLEMLGLRKPRTKTVKIKKKEKTKLIVSSTKKGKKYKRSFPGKFENKQFTINFIKNRVKNGKSNKEITQDYNNLAKRKGWKTRTVSSIQTFKSREKITKKKMNIK